jgi:hypothetical protein
LAARQLIQRIAGRERLVGGGGFPLSRGFLEDSAELSTCGGTGLPPKKVKNKSISNGFIFSLKINPSERIYFWTQKVKFVFHR